MPPPLSLWPCWRLLSGFDSSGGLQTLNKKDMAKKKRSTTSKGRAVSRRFESVYEFSAWLKNTAPTPGFRMSSVRRDADFAGSASYEEADKMLLDGWDSGAADVQKIMMENCSGEEIARRYALSVAGCVPCVPAYLAGSPANMIAIKRRKIARPVVTICYNCAVGEGADASDIRRAAAKLLNIIRGLEAGGVGVNLWVCSFSRSRTPGESVTMAVKIKSSNEPFNLLNMAYPLIHPSFNRRHKFAFIERCGGDSDAWCNYGSAITSQNTMAEMAAAVGIENAACLCYDLICWRSEKRILDLIK